MPIQPTTTPDVIHARSALGVACRTGDAADIDKARDDLAEAKIAAAIEKALADRPALSEARRSRLAALLMSEVQA